VISDDVMVHKDEMEVLLATTESSQDTAISSMMSEIVARHASLVTVVNSRLNLLKKSFQVHELYRDNYHQCQEMIAGAQQQLQQIQDGVSDDIASVWQQMDRLKVSDSLILLLSVFHGSECPVICQLPLQNILFGNLH